MPIKLRVEEVMAREKRDLLEVLKLELEFLRNGGYRQPSSWRPQLIFEDSPTCLNYGKTEHARSCRECVMMQLVPEEHRDENVPCRYIPLNERAETIQSLYATGTAEEIETHLSEWLMSMIERLELEKAAKAEIELDGSQKTGIGRA